MSLRLIAHGLLLMGMAVCQSLLAQTDGNEGGNGADAVRYTVMTTAGETLSGTFVRWSGDTLMLRTEDTTIRRLRRGEIARVMEQSAFEEEGEQDAATAEIQAAFARRPPSGLLLQQSAWPKSDGRVEIAFYEFMFLSAAVSLQDIITFSGMSTFVLGEDNVAGFGMKLSPLVTESVALAGGIYAVEGYDRGTDGFRVYYFCSSFVVGSASVTIGYSHFEDDEDVIPAPYLGFDIPLSRKIRAMVEFSELSRGIGVRMQFGRALFELGVVQLPSRGDYATAPWFALGVVL